MRRSKTSRTLTKHPRRASIIRLVMVLASCCLISRESAAASDTLQTIALSEVPTGWTPPQGLSICNCGSISINNQGDVFFESWETDIYAPPLDAETDWGFWRYRNGQSQPILRSGTQVNIQGVPTHLQRVSGVSSMEDAGLSFVFGSSAPADSQYFDNLWIADGQGLRSIANSGGSMPGVAAEWSNHYFQNYRLDAGGRAIIAASLRRPADSGFEHREGIWFYDGSELRLVAEQTKTLPGLQPGETIRHLNNESLALNARGESVFVAEYATAGTSNEIRQGMWFRSNSGELRPLILGGAQSEVNGKMRTLDYLFHSLAINSNSQVLFRSSLDAPYPAQVQGMWIQNPDGTRRLIAETGSRLPSHETPIELVSLDNFGGSFATLNNQGKVAFMARFYDEVWDRPEPPQLGPLQAFDDVGPIMDPRTPKEGIWTEHNGDYDLVAKLGDPAPGDGRPFLALYPLSMNNFGQVLFSGVLEKNSRGQAITTGLWAQDRSGTLQLIAKTGQQIDVAPGGAVDLRTVVDLNAATSNYYGDSEIFNDRGQIVTGAYFTDGTFGVFLSNQVAVPEPSGVLLFLIGTMGMTSTSRRRYDWNRLRS